MDTAFHREAADRYDEIFTNSVIGSSQRKRVHNYLDDVLNNKAELNILELNCGTGEDALYFVKHGHRIIATDFSQDMLNIADKKIKTTHSSHKYKSCLLDLKNPQLEEENFDLIFSNFGGLNCLNEKELNQLSRFICSKLKPNGSFIAVIMPRDTIFDKWYRILKGEKEKHERRSSVSGIPVNVNGRDIMTYYFNHEEMAQNCPKFKVINVIPTGFVPSYFEQSSIRSILLLASNFLSNFRVSANKADHYLIHFVKDSNDNS